MNKKFLAAAAVLLFLGGCGTKNAEVAEPDGLYREAPNDYPAQPTEQVPEQVPESDVPSL